MEPTSHPTPSPPTQQSILHTPIPNPTPSTHPPPFPSFPFHHPNQTHLFPFRRFPFRRFLIPLRYRSQNFRHLSHLIYRHKNHLHSRHFNLLHRSNPSPTTILSVRKPLFPYLAPKNVRKRKFIDSHIIDTSELKESSMELVPYFLDSFRNPSRIDYGTGHETNFIAWLYCLARLGLIKEQDYQAIVSRVFVKYLELMRKLQLNYCLEPAGSHGVWGLDDHHILPFVFGSAQLIDHKHMKPKSIHNDEIIEKFSDEYMYFWCIGFIKKVKKGPFGEHSPLLNDISGVGNWKKVNSGMLKMY